MMDPDGDDDGGGGGGVCVRAACGPAWEEEMTNDRKFGRARHGRGMGWDGAREWSMSWQ
jgi:hypothetical protein